MKSPARWVGGGLAALWLAGLPAFGQLNLVTRLEHTTFLLYEPLAITLDLENAGARTLVLDGPEQNAELSFQVRDGEGHHILPHESIELPGPWKIEPGRRQTNRVDLLDFYDLERQGSYSIQAVVRWGSHEFAGKKLFIDMVPGLELQRMLVVPPGNPDALLTFGLRKLSRSGGEHLFLRIDDEDENLCYGVINLGRVIQMYKPELRADAQGRVHVLHQSGPSQYTHSVVSADGQPVSRKIHLATGSPRLVEQPDGQLVVNIPAPAPPVGGSATLSEASQPAGKARARDKKKKSP
jgi:hypothetical protein